MGKQVRDKAVEDFKNHIFKKIFPLFEKADKKKLEKAIVSKNLLAISKELGISKDELQTVFGRGQKLAFRIFADFMRQANLIDTLKEFLKNHTR